jgi:hypothetical protein
MGNILLYREDEDMVFSAWKHVAVLLRWRPNETDEV